MNVDKRDGRDAVGQRAPRSGGRTTAQRTTRTTTAGADRLVIGWASVEGKANQFTVTVFDTAGKALATTKPIPTAVQGFCCT